MIKELKNFLFIGVIIAFCFIIVKFYFSDSNKKKYFRSLNNIDEKIKLFSLKIPLIKSNTNNHIEYVESVSVKKNTYKFWELLNKDE